MIEKQTGLDYELDYTSANDLDSDESLAQYAISFGEKRECTAAVCFQDEFPHRGIAE